MISMETTHLGGNHPGPLSLVGICDRVVEEVGKSSCHDNHTGKIQNPVATKGAPTTRGGCGSEGEMCLQGLGITSSLETKLGPARSR